MPEIQFAALPIFRDMDADERQQLLDLTEPVEFASGETIVKQDHLVQNLWFVLSGKCEVKRCTPAGCVVKLAELGPETQFGEMSFFHAAPHSADVIALTEVELLRLSRATYDQLCEENHPVARKLALNSVEQLADRLRRTDQWITDLLCNESHETSVSEWTSFREKIFRGQ